jgi:hypothetical protein
MISGKRLGIKSISVILMGLTGVLRSLGLIQLPNIYLYKLGLYKWSINISLPIHDQLIYGRLLAWINEFAGAITSAPTKDAMCTSTWNVLHWIPASSWPLTGAATPINLKPAPNYNNNNNSSNQGHDLISSSGSNNHTRPLIDIYIYSSFIHAYVIIAA